MKQVFNGKVDFYLIGECLVLARKQCGMLKNIGMDFGHYLDDQLIPRVNIALCKYQEQLEQTLAKDIEKDDYSREQIEAAEQHCGLRRGITLSCAIFYKMLVGMLNDAEPLLQGDMSDVLVTRIASIFENYATKLVQISYNPDHSIAALINIMGNVAFLAHEFLPLLKEQLEGRFKKTFVDLVHLQARLEGKS